MQHVQIKRDHLQNFAAGYIKMKPEKIAEYNRTYDFEIRLDEQQLLNIIESAKYIRYFKTLCLGY